MVFRWLTNQYCFIIEEQYYLQLLFSNAIENNVIVNNASMWLYGQN